MPRATEVYLSLFRNSGICHTQRIILIHYICIVPLTYICGIFGLKISGNRFIATEMRNFLSIQFLEHFFIRWVYVTCIHCLKTLNNSMNESVFLLLLMNSFIFKYFYTSNSVNSWNILSQPLNYFVIQTADSVKIKYQLKLQ